MFSAFDPHPFSIAESLDQQRNTALLRIRRRWAEIPVNNCHGLNYSPVTLFLPVRLTRLYLHSLLECGTQFFCCVIRKDPKNPGLSCRNEETLERRL